MAWDLIFAPRARKELADVPPRDREAIGRALDRLGEDISSVDVKKLAGRVDQWRLRVGRWRVILQMDNATGTIYALRVLPRSEAYRG